MCEVVELGTCRKCECPWVDRNERGKFACINCGEEVEKEETNEC